VTSARTRAVKALRPSVSALEARKLAATVTLDGRLGVDLYFVSDERGGPREVLEPWFAVEFAPQEMTASDGTIRPQMKPIGFLLTEFTAGRVGVGADATPVERRLVQKERGLLNELANRYLSEPGQELPGTAPKYLRWHRQKPDPWDRYRDFLREYYLAVETLLARGGRKCRWKPVSLRAEIAKMEQDVLDPHKTWQAWKKWGLRIPIDALPTSFVSTKSLFEAALAEVWWCVQRHRSARRCKLCGGWFVPSGIRPWLQRYCAPHRQEGSAARHRARRRRNPKRPQAR